METLHNRAAIQINGRTYWTEKNTKKKQHNRKLRNGNTY